MPTPIATVVSRTVAGAPQAYRSRRSPWFALLLAAVPAVSGCARIDTALNSQARLKNGYTIVLPGILGHNFWDDNVAYGLADAQVPSAIEIHDWTLGPHLMALNVFDLSRKRREADKIAQKIVRYQDNYPGRPVHLIGHSGGAALAVQVLESLPDERKVTVAVLLAPAMARRYDLRKAQIHTERGLHSFHSPWDVAIGQGIPLVTGRTFAGGPESAATFGFEPPASLNGSERRKYEHSLTQHPYTFEFVDHGHTGGHFGYTTPVFVQKRLAPIVLQCSVRHDVADPRKPPVGIASDRIDARDDGVSGQTPALVDVDSSGVSAGAGLSFSDARKD